MTTEDRLLLLCSRQDFTPGHRAAAAALAARGVRWGLLADTAERQGVLPIVGANLRRCGVPLPAEVEGRMELAVLENAALKERDADRLATGLASLREVELDGLLLKGTALDLLVYERPWVAASKDIDLTLRPGPGWAKGKGREKDVRRALYTHGVECDLEGHHDITLNGLLPLDFDRIWRDARPIVFRGQPAWVMSSEDLLVSLAVNACRKHFFRLKGLFDLAETLRRGGPFDTARLAAIAREARCGAVVYAALVAARETLGAEVPAGMLEALAVPAPRAAVVRRLVRTFVRRGSFAGGSGIGRALSLASLQPADAVRFLVFRFTRRPKRPNLYSPGPEGAVEAAAGV